MLVCRHRPEVLQRALRAGIEGRRDPRHVRLRSSRLHRLTERHEPRSTNCPHQPGRGVKGGAPRPVNEEAIVESTRERLHGYLSDMLLVERELRAAVRRQCEGSEGLHEAASDLLRGLEADLDDRVAVLTETLEEVEDGEPVVRSALGMILGAAAGLFDRVRLDTQLSRMLRDDYAALSFAAVCYEMLHTTALDLGEPAIARLALRHLAGCARSIARIGDLIPSGLLS